MLNWIWLGLILSSVLLGGIENRLPEVTGAAFEGAKAAVMDLALPMVGNFALWLGIMRLAEKAGAIEALARALRPLLRWLFPEIPSGHPALGSIVMNMAANMLGLSNAATPLGLKAMRELESLNAYPGTATNAMCTFLAINTSSIQLIPTTAIGILVAAGSHDPTAIIGSALIATSCSTIAGVLSVKLLERLRLFRIPKAVPRALPVVESPEDATAHIPLSLGGRCTLGALLLFLIFAVFHGMRAPGVQHLGNFSLVVSSLSQIAVPGMLIFFPLYAALKHVPVYEEFVKGALEGFQTSVRIIPYLVAILVAIGMFRAAGGIQLLSQALAPLLGLLFFPTEILPLVLVRPLSGSGAIGLFAELVRTHGPDSLIARMAGTIIGSTETTFYVIAVYFGSVAISKTRQALPAGLIADGVGVAVSVLVCNLLFHS